MELLRKGLEGTQDEIGARLAADGFAATQATISRDLEDVGAVRRHDGRRIVYSLAESNGPPIGFGRRVIGELVRSVAISGNVIVVRTYPGMAATVAAVLDQGEVDGILGTVAGDDTVFVVADEDTGAKKVAKRIGDVGRAV
jgi:transcriptional regulator of arginine metabolism